MDKKTFLTTVTNSIISFGFTKYKGKIFLLKKDNIVAIVDIQKSNYDAKSYYINYGFIIDDENKGITTPYPSYDFFGRFALNIDGKITDSVDFTLLHEKSFAQDIDFQIKNYIVSAMKFGLENYLNATACPVFPITDKAKKYLTEHQSNPSKT